MNRDILISVITLENDPSCEIMAIVRTVEHDYGKYVLNVNRYSIELLFNFI